MQEESTLLFSNGMWVLVSRLTNANVVNCIWFFKKKHNPYGSLARYKAKLVANRKSQLPNIVYDQKVSPVVKLATIQIILSIEISQY